MPADQAMSPSPFHEGELQVQDRLGVRERIGSFARRAVRDHLPDQHRTFYGMLPFLLAGTVDERGRPWASILAGRPGFLTTPDERTLDIAAPPLFGDPLAATLAPGADIGLLGIQPATRRRNRMNGRITSVRPGGFSVAVGQSFGNCPQFIQTRDIALGPDIDMPGRERPVARADRFDAATRALIERADTLFIATAFDDGRPSASRGVDVSHRGGKPGFVRVEDDRTFVFPDFAGNYHFNTVGNIVLNPMAGFLFIDFDTGDLAYMSGDADIVWEGEALRAFVGAERLIRFRAAEIIRVAGSLPLRFRFGDYSPILETTGSWEQAAATIAADKNRNTYLDYEIADIRPESATITSFYLRRADGRGLASYDPGQFLPIRLAVPGQAEPAARTYTVSDAPGRDHYRLSIKREGADAVVSAFLHDRATVGDRLQAMAPRGKFVLDRSSGRPVVLVSAGVGITPMIAMAQAIIDEGRRTRHYRRTYFIHGARNGRAHAFADLVRRFATEHTAFTAHIRYSRPDDGDRLGDTHDSEGHVDIALLKQVLPLDDYDFYLCGPSAFMRSLYDGLTALGVRAGRIRYESFGPAAVLTGEAMPVATTATPTDKAPVQVCFARSGMEVEWSPDKGTLLELAEAAGLSPAYACRTGICGTCATGIKCGTVDYLDAPSAPLAEDEVLICCSTPRSANGTESCGAACGIVLEL